jgi:hypothetical protein
MNRTGEPTPFGLPGLILLGDGERSGPVADATFTIEPDELLGLNALVELA